MRTITVNISAEDLKKKLGVEAPPPDNSEEFRGAIEAIATEQAAQAKQIKSIEKRPGTVFAISRGAIKLYDLSDQLNGVTKTFALPAFWRVLQVNSSSTAAFRPTVDYTTDASVPNITFTAQINAATTLAAGQTVTILYAEP